MPFKKQVDTSMTKPHKEVVALKLIILFAILLIPLVFILLAMSNQFFAIGRKTAVVKPSLQTNSNQLDTGQDFNFEAKVPSDMVGNLANVPKEKIDTLFNNLKK
jgi:hypothetical protein